MSYSLNSLNGVILLENDVTIRSFKDEEAQIQTRLFLTNPVWLYSYYILITILLYYYITTILIHIEVVSIIFYSPNVTPIQPQPISCSQVEVYSASGYNKGKELMKSSFHLVWPDLIVDPDTAAKLREVTLQMFTEQSKKTGTYLHDLLKKLFALHETNDWLNVFDKTTISATNGLRLPYNDKVSQVYRSLLFDLACGSGCRLDIWTSQQRGL